MDAIERRLLQRLLALEAESDLPRLLQASVQALGELSGWRLAGAARLLGDCGHGQLLALSDRGQALPGFSYPLAIAPCGALQGSHAPLLFDQVQRRFADDPHLVELGIEHYAGCLLQGARGPLGHVFLMHDGLLDAERQAAVLPLLELAALQLGGRLRSADLLEQLQDWQQLADADALTGLANRRAFERELGLQISLVASGARADALLALLDVNGLKAVNDRRGHGAGDHLLGQAARTLEQGLQAGRERLFRIGGDEFVLLVDAPQPAAEEALQDRAAGWRAALAAAGFAEAGWSLGLARLSEAGGERGAWLALADERMYADKRRQKAQRALQGPQR